jgi:hypothetical protein
MTTCLRTAWLLLIAGLQLSSDIVAASPRDPLGAVHEVERSAVDPWAGLDAEERRQVLEGSIAVKTDVRASDEGDTARTAGSLSAAAIVNVSDSKIIWPLLMHPEKQCRFIPRLVQSTVTSLDADRRTVRFIVRLLSVNVLLFQLEYSVRFQAIYHYRPDLNTLSFELDPDFLNEVEQFSGNLHAYTLDDRRCLLRYFVKASVSRLIPQWLQNYVLQHDLPLAVEGFRRYIESSGEYIAAGHVRDCDQPMPSQSSTPSRQEGMIGA